MDAREDPWSVRRTMQIIIHDDTYKDMIKWRSFRPKECLDGTTNESQAFVLMVEPDDTIAAVKAYIQEEKGIPFKKQKLLKEEGEVLKDAQTLVSWGIKDNSALILRYAPLIQISFLKRCIYKFCFTSIDPWPLSRTMEITIQDDTYKDVIKWRSLPKSFKPKFGPVDSNIFDNKDCRAYSFTLMVEPDDTIGAVKAYIEEKKGISFKRQKLLNDHDRVLRDAQTLVSLGIKKDSTLILRYAPVKKIPIIFQRTGRKISLMVEPDDTIGDLKAMLQEKEGLRYHEMIAYSCSGQKMLDDDRLIDYFAT